jgi:hypothetical protein
MFVRTRSASESSSCPMREDFLLHLATFPSKKSKNRPKGMKKKASHRLLSLDTSCWQYRNEERTDMNPQNPDLVSHCVRLWIDSVSPFSSVIRSARCMALQRVSGSKIRHRSFSLDQAEVTRVLCEVHSLLLLPFIRSDRDLLRCIACARTF